jgi:hypothetical protein
MRVTSVSSSDQPAKYEIRRRLIAQAREPIDDGRVIDDRQVLMHPRAV